LRFPVITNLVQKLQIFAITVHFSFSPQLKSPLNKPEVQLNNVGQYQKKIT